MGGFPKMVVPNNHGFSYWKWSFWGVLGVPPFKETPIYTYKYIYTSRSRHWHESGWQKWFMSWAVTISPWLVRLGWKTTQLCGDYIAINHEHFSILSFSTTRIQWNVMRCQFSNCQVLHLLGKLFKIRALALWTRVLWNEGALEGLGSLVDELCFYWRGVVWWCHHHISFYKWVTICFKNI